MTPTAAPSANGTTRAELKDQLVGEPLAEGYRPTLPGWAYGAGGETMPQLYLQRDIELMNIHPVCRSALEFFKGGISSVEFDIRCDQPEAAGFIDSQCQRYWDVGVPKLQGGYEYGWIGCESLYTDKDGALEWQGFKQFSPRDVFLLTQDRTPVGVRVKSVPGREKDQHEGPGRGAGSVDLWLASSQVPAKGVWYAHNPRYSLYYGQSQYLGAWRPWRRLAWKDGAETNLDSGFYRAFYAGIYIRYPNEDLQTAQAGTPATIADSQGNPRRYSRDVARQIAEQFKSGGTVGVPSENYHTEQGGGPKWEVKQLEMSVNVEQGVTYIKHLWDQIRYGVGVPPELMEAAETGSGYTGRAIPLEAFLGQQQRIADALLALFVNQVLRPLVLWNFGPIKWDVKVKPLLETKSRDKQAQANQGAPPQPGMEQPQQPGGSPFPEAQPGGLRQPGMAPGTPPVGGWGGFSLGDYTPGLERVRQIAQHVLRRVAA